MTVARLRDIEVVLAPLPDGEAYTCVTMEEALTKEVYKYGFVPEGASLEVLAEDGNWKVVEPASDGEISLPHATYRLQYEIRNGIHVEAGTVYTVYTAENGK